MNLNIKCDFCKREFQLQALHLTEKNIDLKGEQLIVTSFNCPFCKKEYVVQVDNAETLEILSEYKTKMLRVQNYKKRGQLLSTQQVDSMNKTQDKLKRKRSKLAIKYNRSSYQAKDPKEKLDISHLPDESGEENAHVS